MAEQAQLVRSGIVCCRPRWPSAHSHMWVWVSACRSSLTFARLCVAEGVGVLVLTGHLGFDGGQAIAFADAQLKSVCVPGLSAQLDFD